MSGDVQRVGDLAGVLERARQEAPSEVAIADDGTTAVIQWQGTPVTPLWVTGYVDRLIAAGLVKPYSGLGRDLSPADLRLAQKDNDQRLEAWHRIIGGLPQELLEAARVRFERDGLPEGRKFGYLQPTDVSRWVRARAKRRIPAGNECETHPDEWADSCRPCAEDRKRRRASLPPGFMDRIREELAKQKETSE